MTEDKGLPLLLGDCWIRYTPADPVTDATDIGLMVQAISELRASGDLAAGVRISRATCERLARLVAPYVHDAPVEDLAAIFAVDPNEFARLFHRVALRALYE